MKRVAASLLSCWLACSAGAAARPCCDDELGEPLWGADTPVHAQARSQGLAFYPSAPHPGAFRLAIGGLYDAVDPQVMYGYRLRIPQLTVDARYGLGDGWSLKGHLNSIAVINELLVGASYASHCGRLSAELAASLGVYVGKLSHFGFDAVLFAPQYRPELTLGYDLDEVALSLRVSGLFMGLERVRVGDTWGRLDGANPFVGHSEMLYVENTLASGSLWYFGLGLMTTRAYYALWLLFPDTPGLYTYPRLVAGYEF